MVLIKEIELELSQQKSAPEAIEDSLLKDSVLELTSTNFSAVDDLEDISLGEIRKKVVVDTGYAGKPVSRKKYYKNDLSDEILEEKDISDEAKDVDSDGSSLDNGEISENESVNSIEDQSQQSDHEFEYSGDSRSGSEEENEDSEIDEDDTDEDSDDNIDLSNYHKQDLPEKEKIDIFSSKTKDTDAEVAKGVAVKNQLYIWETLLEARIKLQSSLIAANKLYQKDDFTAFKSKLKPEDESVLSNTCKSLGKLMKTLLELQELLLNSSSEYLKLKRDSKTQNTDNMNEEDDNESISSSLCSGNEEEDNNQKPDLNSSSLDEPKRKKIKLGNYSNLLEELYEDFKPFRDKTIQMWNDKTRINSGKISNSDFSAFDQPILKQIEQILLDKNRLIRKTQLKRSDYEILGKKQHEEGVNDDDVKESERIQKEYDPEIFDDDDFYHKLLRDFITRKCSDATDSKNHGRQWLEIQHLRSKMKRKIDTRCTKGRKLRYTVHNKLVNFMAPIPCNTWSVEAENQLFKSLFGKASEESSSLVNN